MYANICVCIYVCIYTCVCMYICVYILNIYFFVYLFCDRVLLCHLDWSVTHRDPPVSTPPGKNFFLVSNCHSRSLGNGGAKREVTFFSPKAETSK